MTSQANHPLLLSGSDKTASSLGDLSSCGDNLSSCSDLSSPRRRGSIHGNTNFSTQDQIFMRRAIELAKQAESQQEVPVGAVLVLNNGIISEGFNQPISLNDPTAHAEIIAIRKAAEKMSNYRLINTTLYVTLEPCMMCAGAIVHSRIARLVYGAKDIRSGAIESQEKMLDKNFLNHRVEYHGGLFEEECADLLSQFFRKKRIT